MYVHVEKFSFPPILLSADAEGGGIRYVIVVSNFDSRGYGSVEGFNGSELQQSAPTSRTHTKKDKKDVAGRY